MRTAPTLLLHTSSACKAFFPRKGKASCLTSKCESTNTVWISWSGRVAGSSTGRRRCRHGDWNPGGPLAQPSRNTWRQAKPAGRPRVIDFSTFLSSAFGSLLAGVFLLTSAPLWWKWWSRIRDNTSMEPPKWLVSLALVGIPLVIALFLIGLSAELEVSLEKGAIPPHHPGLTEEKAALAIAECDMKSVAVTAGIRRESSRDKARRKYKSACLLEKGFRWSLAASGPDT